MTTYPGAAHYIHQQPRRTEIVACAPWLTTELDLVAPTW